MWENIDFFFFILFSFFQLVHFPNNEFFHYSSRGQGCAYVACILLLCAEINWYFYVFLFVGIKQRYTHISSSNSPPESNLAFFPKCWLFLSVFNFQLNISLQFSHMTSRISQSSMNFHCASFPFPSIHNIAYKCTQVSVWKHRTGIFFKHYQLVSHS